MRFQQEFRINTNTAPLDTYQSYSKPQADLGINVECIGGQITVYDT